MAFEETREELVVNAASLEFDLDKLVREGKLAIDHVHVDPHEIAETGEYDLEGLFIRLKYAIESVGAKRVVLDTIETLFSGFSNTALLRAKFVACFNSSNRSALPRSSPANAAKNRSPASVSRNTSRIA